MQITIPCSSLCSTLQAVMEAIPSRPVLPVLSHVRMDVAPEGMTLSATDLDLSLSATCADIEAGLLPVEAGTVLLPAKTMHALVDAFDATTPLTICAEGATQVVLSGGERATYRLRGYPAEDFPDLPEVASMPRVATVPRELLLALFRATYFAASRELFSSRPALTGVCFRADGETLTATATDGHRLSQVCAPFDVAFPDDVIVPRRAVQAFGKLLARSEVETVILGLNAQGSFLSLQCGGVTAATRLLEGPYVNVAQIFPTSLTGECRVAREALLHVVRRALVMTDAHTSQLFLAVAPTQMTVVGEDVSSGARARQSLPADANGECRISWNGAYWLSILQSLSGETVVIGWTTDQGPAVFRSEGEGHAFDHRCLLMPLRVAGSEWERALSGPPVLVAESAPDGKVADDERGETEGPERDTREAWETRTVGGSA